MLYSLILLLAPSSMYIKTKDYSSPIDHNYTYQGSVLITRERSTDLIYKKNMIGDFTAVKGVFIKDDDKIYQISWDGKASLLPEASHNKFIYRPLRPYDLGNVSGKWCAVPTENDDFIIATKCRKGKPIAGGHAETRILYASGKGNLIATVSVPTLSATIGPLMHHVGNSFRLLTVEDGKIATIEVTFTPDK